MERVLGEKGEKVTALLQERITFPSPVVVGLNRTWPKFSEKDVNLVILDIFGSIPW